MSCKSDKTVEKKPVNESKPSEIKERAVGVEGSETSKAGKSDE